MTMMMSEKWEETLPSQMIIQFRFDRLFNYFESRSSFRAVVTRRPTSNAEAEQCFSWRPRFPLLSSYIRRAAQGWFSGSDTAFAFAVKIFPITLQVIKFNLWTEILGLPDLHPAARGWINEAAFESKWPASHFLGVSFIQTIEAVSDWRMDSINLPLVRMNCWMVLPRLGLLSM